MFDSVVELSESVIEAVRAGSVTHKDLRLVVIGETSGYDSDEYYEWVADSWDKDDYFSSRAFRAFVNDGHLPREFTFTLRVSVNASDVIFERDASIKVKPADLDGFTTVSKSFKPLLAVRKALFDAILNGEIHYFIDDTTKYGYCAPALFGLRVVFDGSAQ